MDIYTRNIITLRAMNFISLTTRVYLSIMVLLLIRFSVWYVERLHNIVLKVYCYLAECQDSVHIHKYISIVSIILSYVSL